MAFSNTPVKQWKVSDVVDFFTVNELTSVLDAIRSNGVDGEMLLDLSDKELETELGFRPLQIKKMKRELEELQQGLAKGMQGLSMQDNTAAAAAAAAAAQQAAAVAQQAATAATAQQHAAAAAQQQQQQQQAAAVAQQAAAQQAAAAAAAAQQQQQQQQAAAGQAAARFGAASAALAAAARDLIAAGDHLQKAMKSQAVGTGLDLGHRGFRDPTPGLDMATSASAHQHCKAAHGLADKASAQIREARRHVPELPPIKVPDVAIVGGIIMQELFDSTMADVRRLSKIKHAAEDIARCEREVHAAYNWCAATSASASRAAAPAPAVGVPAAAYAAPPPPAMYAAPTTVVYTQAPAPQQQGNGAGKALVGGVLLGAAIARPGGIGGVGHVGGVGHIGGIGRRW